MQAGWKDQVSMTVGFEWDTRTFAADAGFPLDAAFVVFFGFDAAAFAAT